MLPAGRPEVISAAAGVLVARDLHELAAEAWLTAQCHSYERELCGNNARWLADLLAREAFEKQGIRDSVPAVESSRLGIQETQRGKVHPSPLPPFAPSRASDESSPARTDVAENDIAIAMQIWNRAVDNGALEYPRVRTGRITDGEFARPLIGPAFSWGDSRAVPIEIEPILQATLHGNVAVLRFSGDQPESCELLAQLVPVEPGRRYRISYASRKLSYGVETGVQVQVIAANKALATVPAALTHEWQSVEGEFSVPLGIYVVDVSLQYVRPAGEVRLRDTVAVANVKMDFTTENTARRSRNQSQLFAAERARSVPQTTRDYARAAGARKSEFASLPRTP
jgi:hypothetical protein